MDVTWQCEAAPELMNPAVNQLLRAHGLFPTNMYTQLQDPSSYLSLGQCCALQTQQLMLAPCQRNTGVYTETVCALFGWAEEQGD